MCAKISLVLRKGGRRAWKDHLGPAQYSVIYMDIAAMCILTITNISGLTWGKWLNLPETRLSHFEKEKIITNSWIVVRTSNILNVKTLIFLKIRAYSLEVEDAEENTLLWWKKVCKLQSHKYSCSYQRI